MVTLQIPSNFKPEQIEIPNCIDRSCKGALHLRPGSKKVTSAEWYHLKKTAPKLAAKIQASESKPEAAAKKKEVEVKSEPEPENPKRAAVKEAEAAKKTAAKKKAADHKKAAETKKKAWAKKTAGNK